MLGLGNRFVRCFLCRSHLQKRIDASPNNRFFVFVKDAVEVVGAIVNFSRFIGYLFRDLIGVGDRGGEVGHGEGLLFGLVGDGGEIEVGELRRVGGVERVEEREELGLGALIVDVELDLLLHVDLGREGVGEFNNIKEIYNIC